jgi:hypothetical protein
MPKRVRDLLATIAVLVVLFGMLVSINPRVREHASGLSGGVSEQEWTASTGAVEKVVHSVVVMTSHYAADNTYLFVFGIAAVVLFVLMLRT